jgi:hypothetical protein
MELVELALQQRLGDGNGGLGGDDICSRSCERARVSGCVARAAAGGEATQEEKNEAYRSFRCP